jgi:hypothetical protein
MADVEVGSDCEPEVMKQNRHRNHSKSPKAGQEFYLTTDISVAFRPIRGRKPPKAHNESRRLQRCISRSSRLEQSEFCGRAGFLIGSHDPRRSLWNAHISIKLRK